MKVILVRDEVDKDADEMKLKMVQWENVNKCIDAIEWL